MGTLNAAITLTRALADAHFRGHRPSRIINAGTAGSLIPSCSGIFEIDHVIKHDFDHETLTAITGRPLPTAGLAAGDTFISDTATRDRLAQQAQLCDMEGYAVVKVAREFGIPVTLNLTFTTMTWLGLAGVGGCATPAHPRKDGTSHQICPNGRFGNDLV
ncbi:nucleosidase [Corynebacterium diphtheriae]|uniref:nucleosidase n=1 Tax=Corynebacterium diphtheriae TaxID=1717 RepID=UPI000EB42F9B|nr:nucleosidase [Corynebacterium diphtheriae]RKW93583.1 nucleosidase [Corynebacterium diphtheriae]